MAVGRVTYPQSRYVYHDRNRTGMGCNRVIGYMCLGLILYLSTFPSGKAQIGCTELNGDCSVFLDPCCDNLTCFTFNSTTSICLNCTAESDTCGDGIVDCCPGSTCFTNYSDNNSQTCLECTGDGAGCGDDKPDCCEGLVCTQRWWGGNWFCENPTLH